MDITGFNISITSETVSAVVNVKVFEQNHLGSGPFRGCTLQGFLNQAAGGLLRSVGGV